MPRQDFEKYRERKQYRKDNGLCLYCSSPLGVDGTTMICRPCADKRSKYYRKRKEERLCQTCGEKLPEGSKIIRCDQCQSVVLKYANNVNAERNKMKLCIYCGSTDVLISTMEDRNQYCEPCYMRRVSVTRLGTTKHASIIHEKLKSQGYRCAYTGEPLILGVNSSLDHILPSSRYPHLKNDPTNVEWVTCLVNATKGDKTKDEFLAFIGMLSQALPQAQVV